MHLKREQKLTPVMQMLRVIRPTDISCQRERLFVAPVGVVASYAGEECRCSTPGAKETLDWGLHSTLSGT